MDEQWPALPYEAWRETRDALHLKLQVVGKVRLALSPFEPQWNNVPLYPTARGLTTSPMAHPGGNVLDLEADLLEHHVDVRVSTGAEQRVGLHAGSVADFHAELMTALERAGVPVTITELPSELPDAIPFPDDTAHRPYEAQWVTRFWRVLLQVEAVMNEHRARFRGRTTPVQLFWGSFDLANTRFNGRAAEPPPNADVIMRESANAEQICVGFWPGFAAHPEPAFFAYAYPQPAGIEDEAVRPEAASWSREIGEFLLPYEAVRTAPDPRRALLDFLESTYEAGARLSGWDEGLTA